jgi:hypothetical protein
MGLGNASLGYEFADIAATIAGETVSSSATETYSFRGSPCAAVPLLPAPRCNRTSLLWPAFAGNGRGPVAPFVRTELGASLTAPASDGIEASPQGGRIQPEPAGSMPR